MQSINVAKFLNITSLSLSSASFAAVSAAAPVICMVPLAIIYASLIYI